MPGVSAELVERAEYAAAGRVVRHDGDRRVAVGAARRADDLRYVWAGDQVLWELRAPGADGDNLEATTGAFEPRFYGRVSYPHAGGIDRPLSIWKEGVESVRPDQNWRGQFSRGR